MHSERRIVRAAGSMGAMTLLSRVTGYVRDSLQAGLLGAAQSSDAFVIAFRIPNMLRRLVGEGALNSAFVPTFTRYRQAGDMVALWRFAGSVLYTLSATLAALVVLGVVGSPFLVRLLAWGFAVDPARFDLTVALNRLMFPYIFCVALSALGGAILNAFDRFALPAFTPVLLNLSIIVAAVTLGPRFTEPAFAFAIGVLVGGVLQLAVQVPALLRHGLDLRPPRVFDRAGLREVGRLMLPRAFGAGITQINLVVDSQFAASLAAGSVSFLYYAVRVEELTLGVFAVSLSTVVLPALSRAAANGDAAGVRDTLGTAIRLLLFVTLPATAGLVVLRVPIIHVLFERGRFGPEDTLFTASALAFYALGLLPYAAVSVLATAFYAHRDTRTPVIVAALTFGIHIALNFALSGPLRHNGIALSTALSALIDAGLLLWLLQRRVGRLLTGEVLRTALRSAGAGAAMTVGLLAATSRWDVTAIAGIGPKVAALAALVAGGGGLYLGLAVLSGSREARLLKAMVSRRP
jgi:putative peptidoglycan lipid II flippase